MIKTHIIVDFYKADRVILARTEDLRAALERAILSLNVEVCNDNYIQFEPEGATATVVTKVFHFSIHTWPEYYSCTVDLYSSQDATYASNVAEALKQELLAKEYDLKILPRFAKQL